MESTQVCSRFAGERCLLLSTAGRACKHFDVFLLHPPYRIYHEGGQGLEATKLIIGTLADVVQGGQSAPSSTVVLCLVSSSVIKQTHVQQNEVHLHREGRFTYYPNNAQIVCACVYTTVCPRRCRRPQLKRAVAVIRYDQPERNTCSNMMAAMLQDGVVHNLCGKSDCCSYWQGKAAAVSVQCCKHNPKSDNMRTNVYAEGVDWGIEQTSSRCL